MMNNMLSFSEAKAKRSYYLYGRVIHAREYLPIGKVRPTYSLSLIHGLRIKTSFAKQSESFFGRGCGGNLSLLESQVGETWRAGEEAR